MREYSADQAHGLSCAAQVARQPGVELLTMEIAQTFADVEAALSR